MHAGNIKEEEAFMDMAKRYLASIPRVVDSSPITVENITELKLQFPSSPVRSTVPVNMVEPTANVQITFPVQVWPLHLTVARSNCSTGDVSAFATSIPLATHCYVCALCIITGHYTRTSQH